MLLKKCFSALFALLLLCSYTSNAQTITERFQTSKAEMAKLQRSSSTNARNQECTDPFNQVSVRFEDELGIVKAVSEEIAVYKTRDILNELFVNLDIISDTYTEYSTNSGDSTSSGLSYNTVLTSEALADLSDNLYQISTMRSSIESFYNQKKNLIARSDSKLVGIKRDFNKIVDCIDNEIQSLNSGTVTELEAITLSRLEKERDQVNGIIDQLDALRDANLQLINSVNELQASVVLFMHTMSESSKLFNTASIAYKTGRIAQEHLDNIYGNMGEIQTLSSDLSEVSSRVLSIADGL